MPAILSAYTWLTGRTAPPPLWALGYHQCRWFHYTQDDVEQIAAQHRGREIPCDGLWLDIDYMDGYRVFTWDEQAFPDADGMLRRLGEQGFKVITIVDPGIKAERGYWVFDQARERLNPGGKIYVMVSSDSDLDLFGKLIDKAGFHAKLAHEYSILIESFIIYELAVS